LFLCTSAQKIEEMRVNIEDLEALKELGEELEENHIETEKTMQDEISTCSSIRRIGRDKYDCRGLDEKDVQLAERQQRIESLEEVCQDMERTISRFRELVIQLERLATSGFEVWRIN
jgi:dynactin 1